jgi:hypothetical protein
MRNRTSSSDYIGPLAEKSTLTYLIRPSRHNLQIVVARKVPDPMFPAAKMTWDRLRSQYPSAWSVARATLVAAFEGGAATLYNEDAAYHPLADE